MKKSEPVSQPECSYCGGLHFGSPRNICVYKCPRCGRDTREDAVGFGHTKCACAPLPSPEEPAKPLAGLWRNNPETLEGKYLLVRRDGSIVEWPHFAMGAKDPASPAGLRAYAAKARELEMNEQYCHDVEELADFFDEFRLVEGEGDPDRGRHRKDDPATSKLMRHGKSA